MPRKIVTAAELKPPDPISDDDLAEICRTSKIPMNRLPEVRHFLGEAVTVFGEAMRRERKFPKRRIDRVAIERTIRDIRRAQHRLKQNRGPAGLRALRVAGRQIAPALSTSWMRDRFPGDSDAPGAIYLRGDDLSLRSSARMPARPVDTENLSLEGRIHFMEQRRGAAIAALLADIADALDSGRRAIVQLPDGRKPLEQRAFMLAALAKLWHGLKRRPTGGVNSKFGVFCENVFDAIGWPTDGVNAALPGAIALWRDRYR